MRIAIFDSVNQDIGLKILFPQGDYYINNVEESTIINIIISNEYYKIQNNLYYNNITDKSYDILLIIITIYDIIDDTKLNIKSIYNNIISIINKNNFKFVAIFDNSDYDYDPNEYINNPKINIFFKKYYNKNKIYNDNVVPFPFIMFGTKSLIEKCDRELVSEEEYFKPKNNCIFSNINDNTPIYNQIKHNIFNPGNIDYNTLITYLRNSKYSLNLLNNRNTVNILLSGSLMISEFNNLNWTFENNDNFMDETIFKDENDFIIKMNNLINNEELFKSCLNNQYKLVKKYFNKDWIKNYILKYINQRRKRILFINPNIHHKNINFILKCKKIDITICNSSNELFNYDLNAYDVLYSPGELINISNYPNIKFIFGPNIMVFPDESLNIIKGENLVYNLLSDWVIDVWKSFPITENIKFVKLPFGVETDKFIETKNINDRNKILVYFKHRNPNHLSFIVNYLNSKGLEFKIFSYDHRYDEYEYIKYLQDTKYFICIDAHESQGFAIQEALSCNIPLLVWNIKTMADEFGSSYSEEHKATTIPYWDDRCGHVFYEEYEFETAFNIYINNINNYKPREYILEHLSFEACENKLIDFINTY